MERKSVMFCMALILLVSCNKEEKDPDPEYNAILATGVVDVKFVNGTANVRVEKDDVVAVFSTASETEHSYPYSIKLSGVEAKSLVGNYDYTPLKSPEILDFKSQTTNRAPMKRKIDVQSHTAAFGGTGIFWTYDLSDMSLFPDLPVVQFTAELKARGEHCDVYVDVNSQTIDYKDAEAIAQQFDQVVFPVVTAQFGKPPITNGSSRLTILMPLAFNGGIENMLNPDGASTGLFQENDLYPQSENNPYSNYQNTIFLNIGLFNDTNSFYKDKWRPILSHEFQHMISYGYHKGKEGMPIEEGKALLAEILSGYGLPEGDILQWSNIMGYQYYPSVISLLQMDYSMDNINGTYGMGLLWESYIYDRFGKKALYDMVTSSLHKLDAVASITGISKEHLFAEWVQANIVSSTTSNKIFKYQTIDIEGDGGGRYFRPLIGFAALPQHAIPETEEQHEVPSFGVNYFRADSSGELVINGNSIKVFVIKKSN